MQIQAERGYLIPAINTNVDYVACANQLANSIQHWHPAANITVVTEDMLPYGNLGGFVNDWQMFYVSPYRQTIKLEADMVAASPIDHWWTLFEKRDVVISQGCRTFYNQPSKSRAYRKIFDANNLPDVYNAITYWRVSATAQAFFKTVRQIFENWQAYKTLIKYPEEVPSTDVVYAIAAVLIGPELVTLPPGIGPTIVHMKRFHQSLSSEDWTKELVWEVDPLRINTVAQHGLVHYNVKDWRL